MTKSEMIYRALTFANEAHRGQLRKDTDIAYITHPVEVMCVMNAMGLTATDPNLIVAGLLHDVVEDTDVTLDMVREKFGDDVASLVDAHTEDKNDTWENRKGRLINELRTANDRVKLLVMADAMANLQDIYRDIKMEGDKLWERFHRPKEKQYWYYRNVINALESLKDQENVAEKYKEMEGLFEKVFSGVEAQLADKNVQSVIEKWKLKKEEYREEWEKGFWPAKYVSITFELAEKQYCFKPDTIGLETGDSWDEGFMEYLEKYIITDLEGIGAKNIYCLGFLD